MSNLKTTGMNSFFKSKRKNRSGFNILGNKTATFSGVIGPKIAPLRNNLLSNNSLYKKFMNKKLAERKEKKGGEFLLKKSHRKSKTIAIGNRGRDKYDDDEITKKDSGYEFKKLKRKEIKSSRMRNLSNKAKEPNLSFNLKIPPKNKKVGVKKERIKEKPEIIKEVKDSKSQVEEDFMMRYQSVKNQSLVKKPSLSSFKKWRSNKKKSENFQKRNKYEIVKKDFRKFEVKFDKLKLSKNGRLKQNKCFNLLKISNFEHKLPKLEKSKVITKEFGIVKSFAVNTHVGTVRDYNEDRVSILLNAQQR